MTTNFHTAHAFTAKWEGGLTDHPSDPGGITKYGVSLRYLRGKGLDLGDIDGDGDIDAADIRALTPEQAARLFKLDFWDAPRLDEFHPAVALCLYDGNVNMGPAQSTRLAQRAYNALLGYPDVLVVDGVLGAKTRQALQERGMRLAELMCAWRCKFYFDLAAAKPQFQPFLQGWLNRTDALRAYLPRMGMGGAS